MEAFPFKVGQGAQGGMGRLALMRALLMGVLEIYTLAILYRFSQENCQPFGGRGRTVIRFSKQLQNSDFLPI
jgi:hypothetical protein